MAASCWIHDEGSEDSSQLPDLSRISSLNAVPFRLPSVTRNDSKVRSGNSEDSSTVVGVWAKSADAHQLWLTQRDRTLIELYLDKY